MLRKCSPIQIKLFTIAHATFALFLLAMHVDPLMLHMTNLRQVCDE